MTKHPLRWLIGSALVSLAGAGGALAAIDAASGGSAVRHGGQAQRSTAMAQPATRASGVDLGRIWGEVFRGRAASYEALSTAEAQANATPGGAVVKRAANIVRFTGATAALTIVANPPTGRDMAFRAAGLENPTIEVRQGAMVIIRFVNGDNDSAHGWLLLDPIVQTGRTVHGPRAFSGAYAPILGDPTAAGQPLETIRFRADRAGIYRYECPVPGHAAMGMQGTFAVTT